MISSEKKLEIYSLLYLLFSIFLYLFTLFFTPIEKGYRLILKEGDSGYSSETLAFLFLTIIFIVLFYFQNKLYEVKPNKIIYVLSFLIIMLFFSAYPFFSGDIFLYIYKGKILLEKGISPYSFVPPDQSIYRLLSVWTHTPTAYGPFSAFIFKYLYIKSFSPFINMYIFKLFFILNFVLLIIFLNKIKTNYVFYLFSPLLLLETALSSHLEIIPLLFFSISTYLIKAKKYFFAFFILGVAVSFKINYIIFLFPFLLKIYKEKRINLIFLSSLSFTISGIFPVFLFEPNKYIKALKFEAAKYGIYPLLILKKFKIPTSIVLAITLLILIFLSYKYLANELSFFRFVLIFFLLYLLFDKNFQPWHLFPLYGIYILEKPPRFDFIGLFSLIAVYSIYFLHYSWNPMQNFIASTLLLLIILFDIYRTFGNLTLFPESSRIP